MHTHTYNMSRSPVLVISKLGAVKSFFSKKNKFFFQSKYMQLYNIYLSRDSTRFIKIEVKKTKLCLIKVEILPKKGPFNVENFRPFRIILFVINMPCLHAFYLLYSNQKISNYYLNEVLDI